MNHVLSLGLIFFLYSCRIPLIEKPIKTDNQEISGKATIALLQGAGHISPYNQYQVEDVKGVVTLIEAEGFWMQSPMDERKTASQGLFVYDKGESGVQTGDLVEVSGMIQEHGETNELTLTELIFPRVEILASSSSLPLFSVIESPVFHPVICNDGPQGVSRSFYDPDEDLIDYWENFEGMVLTFEQLTVAGGTKSGQIPLLVGKGPWDKGVPLPLLIMEIAGQDSEFETAALGDFITGPVRAVLTYKWGEFTLLPLGAWSLNKGPTQEHITNIDSSGNKLTLASFNLENYSCQSSGLTELEFMEKQSRLIETMAVNLNSPSIIAVQEIMDDDGSGDRGLTEGWKNFTSLTEALNTATGRSYYYASADPEDGTDGGLPGANIRTGFIYDLDRVTLTGLPERICLEEYIDCRKPLLARFNFKGNEIVLINVHLSSRMGDTPIMGEYQPPLLLSGPNRLYQAQALKEILPSLRAENLIIMGDFNDYTDSPVLGLLKGTPGTPSFLQDGMENLNEEQRFSYIYKGRPGQLDHILISPNLADSGFEGEILHLNSGISEYERASDHDPLLVSLTFLDQLPEPDKVGGLFFCDYGEGSGYNKYLELANLSGRDTSIGEYALIYCANGIPPEQGSVLLLPAMGNNTLAGICHSRSEEILLSQGSILNCPSFNGNDQLILIKDTNRNGTYEKETDSLIDIIGYPLSEEDFAKDRGMRRQPWVSKGSEIFNPREWIPYSKESVDGGGFYGNHRTNQEEMRF